MDKFYIAALRIDKRSEKAPSVQEVLTKFGCIIKMRLGLHEAGNVCSDRGLIILELVPDKEEIDKLLETLNSVKGVTAKLLEI